MVCPLIWLRCRRRRWDVACKLAQGPGTANLTEARASLADEYGQPVHVGLPCAKARHSTECRLADPRARRRIASGFAANVLLDLLYQRRFGQRGLGLDVFQSGPLLASANANQMAYSGSFRLIPAQGIDRSPIFAVLNNGTGFFQLFQQFGGLVG